MRRKSPHSEREPVGPETQSKSRKQRISRFHNPPAFICLNCDQSIEVTGQIKLFCSELCAEEAKFVRYFRRCSDDGRIKQADVKEAIEIRFAHIMSGDYPARERQVPRSLRAEVIARDKGVCCKCGEAGTTLDHIDGDANELDNLQLLCNACHNEKTKLRIAEMMPNDKRYPAFRKGLNSSAFVVMHLGRCVCVMTANSGPHAIRESWLSGAYFRGTKQMCGHLPEAESGFQHNVDEHPKHTGSLE